MDQQATASNLSRTRRILLGIVLPVMLVPAVLLLATAAIPKEQVSDPASQSWEPIILAIVTAVWGMALAPVVAILNLYLAIIPNTSHRKVFLLGLLPLGVLFVFASIGYHYFPEEVFRFPEYVWQ